MARVQVFAVIILSPLLLPILLACILLSKHIFANVVYSVAFSAFVWHQSTNVKDQTMTVYFYCIWCIHTIFTLIRIVSLCVYRRTQTFHRISLAFMISSIQISLLHTLQTYDTHSQNNDTLAKTVRVCYSIIAILVLSEFWIRSSAKQLAQIENEILKLVIHKNKHKNQEIQRFKAIDSSLKIDRKYAANISYLHCHTNGSKQKKLVLIHGYVVGKCVFAIAIRWLARYFDVYIIDAPGNGLSKPVWLPWLSPSLCGHTSKSDKWTANAIEKWRMEVFGDESIYLLGHSTGAYMCSVYTIYFANHIRYLILCSPVCLLSEKEYLHCSGLLSIDRAQYGIGATILSKYFWNFITWQDIVRGLGIFGPLIFINGLRQTHKHHTLFGDFDPSLCAEMSDLWFRYTYDLHAQPKSYEDLLYAYMKPWCWPRQPLVRRLANKIKCNLLLIYAENEISMSDKFGGIKLINELKYANNCEWNYEANLEIIKDSSHQLFLNQPIKCVKAILKHTHSIDCD